MNRIDFLQDGGLGFSEQIADAMQKAYKTSNEFGRLAGDLVIVSDCIESGGIVSDGFVIINGELLKFKGTAKSNYVIIQEVAESPRGFKDGSAKPVIYERYATFGNSDTQYLWTDFKRPLTLLQIEAKLTQLENMVPIGLVAIWDRPFEAIPVGWVEHTDLSGRTAVGHLDGDVNFGALGYDIGTSQVTLDITQIPEHYHIQGSESLYNDYGGGTVVGNRTYPDGIQPSKRNQRTSSVGGNQPHSNIQPSRIVKYIRFVGFN